ncbi:MAG: histidine phosphatase family protein [Bacteroidetes bacterium]|nr:MAG: histidine phosphatase family protein [Bacteroidota bacterium]
MKKWCFVLFLAGLSACFLPQKTATSPDSQTVIFLFRHAEKDTSVAKDPPLTETGLRRARDLARALREAGISRIFSSDFRRTRQTVEPLAREQNREIEVYDPRNLDDFARRLRGMSGRIAVSGHSNTTPELVRLLGGDPQGPIGEAWEYDRLYVLTLENGRLVSSVLLRFGAACAPVR